jgi:tetratricopeptide (TPR) repeat protein
MQGFDEWEKESLTNKRLLPRYGHLAKTEGEISDDSSFILRIMSQLLFKTRRDASNHLIKLGFDYFYRDDLKTAMYRFNQAYLLDSTTSEDYWGYGAIYMRFGMIGLAAEQYEAGLKIDPANTHLLTDYATAYLAQYYRLGLEEVLDSAIHNLHKSYSINPKDVNTAFKLSICYWHKNKCEEAWKFYDACVALGGQPITEEFKKDMKVRCKRN